MDTQPTIIEDRVVLQRVGEHGPRIGRVQRIEYKGHVTEVNFWYDENGKLLKVL